MHQPWYPQAFNPLRPRQDGRHFADDIFTCIFFNENGCILIKFSLKYVHKGLIDNNPALVQIMAWRRPGDKPLSEPMVVRSLTHICVTQPQWVKQKDISELAVVNTKVPNAGSEWQAKLHILFWHLTVYSQNRIIYCHFDWFRYLF